MRTAIPLPDADALHLEARAADGDAITVVVATRGDTCNGYPVHPPGIGRGSRPAHGGSGSRV